MAEKSCLTLRLEKPFAKLTAVQAQRRDVAGHIFHSVARLTPWDCGEPNWGHLNLKRGPYAKTCVYQSIIADVS